MHRIGILGAGTITREVHLPVLRSMTNVQIAWVADIDWARASAVAHANRVRAERLPHDATCLPECDAVLIATPVGFRAAYYEAFARKGWAILAEKPFSVTSAEHLRLMRLFPAHRVGCGYMRRFYASIRLLRKSVAEGWFGALRRVILSEGARTTRTGVAESHYDDVMAAGGGVLLSLGCHGIDAILYVTNASDFVVRGSDLLMDDGIDRRAAASVKLMTPHGACQAEFCFSWIDSQENLMRLEFENAVLTVGLQPGSDVLVSGGRFNAGLSGQAGGSDGVPAARTTNQAFYLEWTDFLSGIVAKQPSVIAAQSSLLTAALIDELYGREGVRF